jgi:hypothetical protein
VNAPGATVCASVTVPCGIDIDARLSHVAATAVEAHAKSNPAAAAMAIRVDFMRRILTGG